MPCRRLLAALVVAVGLCAGPGPAAADPVAPGQRLTISTAVRPADAWPGEAIVQTAVVRNPGPDVALRLTIRLDAGPGCRRLVTALAAGSSATVRCAGTARAPVLTATVRGRAASRIPPLAVAITRLADPAPVPEPPAVPSPVPVAPTSTPVPRPTRAPVPPPRAEPPQALPPARPRPSPQCLSTLLPVRRPLHRRSIRSRTPRPRPRAARRRPSHRRPPRPPHPWRHPCRVAPLSDRLSTDPAAAGDSATTDPVADRRAVADHRAAHDPRGPARRADRPSDVEPPPPVAAVDPGPDPSADDPYRDDAERASPAGAAAVIAVLGVFVMTVSVGALSAALRIR